MSVIAASITIASSLFALIVTLTGSLVIVDAPIDRFSLECVTEIARSAQQSLQQGLVYEATVARAVQNTSLIALRSPSTRSSAIFNATWEQRWKDALLWQSLATIRANTFSLTSMSNGFRVAIGWLDADSLACFAAPMHSDASRIVTVRVSRLPGSAASAVPNMATIRDSFAFWPSELQSAIDNGASLLTARGYLTAWTTPIAVSFVSSHAAPDGKYMYSSASLLVPFRSAKDQTAAGSRDMIGYTYVAVAEETRRVLDVARVLPGSYALVLSKDGYVYASSYPAPYQWLLVVPGGTTPADPGCNPLLLSQAASPLTNVTIPCNVHASKYGFEPVRAAAADSSFFLPSDKTSAALLTCDSGKYFAVMIRIEEPVGRYLRYMLLVVPQQAAVGDLDTPRWKAVAVTIGITVFGALIAALLSVMLVSPIKSIALKLPSVTDSILAERRVICSGVLRTHTTTIDTEIGCGIAVSEVQQLGVAHAAMARECREIRAFLAPQLRVADASPPPARNHGAVNVDDENVMPGVVPVPLRTQASMKRKAVSFADAPATLLPKLEVEDISAMHLHLRDLWRSISVDRRDHDTHAAVMTTSLVAMRVEAVTDAVSSAASARGYRILQCYGDVYSLVKKLSTTMDGARRESPDDYKMWRDPTAARTCAIAEASCVAAEVSNRTGCPVSCGVFVGSALCGAAGSPRKAMSYHVISKALTVAQALEEQSRPFRVGGAVTTLQLASAASVTQSMLPLGATLRAAADHIGPIALVLPRDPAAGPSSDKDVLDELSSRVVHLRGEALAELDESGSVGASTKEAWKELETDFGEDAPDRAELEMLFRVCDVAPLQSLASRERAVTTAALRALAARCLPAYQLTSKVLNMKGKCPPMPSDMQ